MLFNKIEAIIFDFDGVLTNNLVYVDQDGGESVCCSRADGLAFDVLRKLKKPSYILSTEKNLVVSVRAKKLKIPVIQGVSDKAKGVRNLAKEKNINLKNVLYVGNDLNDYHAMQICGYTACPSDSHKSIQSISDIVIEMAGGEGVVRKLLEDVFHLDFMKILYPKESLILRLKK
jgi:3-deoxy-D-manno-octulosonate 8-phosphate phosphatase (KDO 8-P phosphatase)